LQGSETIFTEEIEQEVTERTEELSQLLLLKLCFLRYLLFKKNVNGSETIFSEGNEGNKEKAK